MSSVTGTLEDVHAASTYRLMGKGLPHCGSSSAWCG